MSQKLEEMFNEIRYPSQITTDKAITTSAALTAGSVTTTGAAALGSTTITGTQSVSGTTTPTGGIVPSGGTSMTLTLEAVPIGSVAYGSMGTDTAPVVGSMNVISVAVPTNFTATNINMLQGTNAGGTGKFIGVIYNAAGTAVANSTTAGIAAAATNSFLTLPLTSTVSLVGPARYYVGIQSNATTEKIRLVAADTYVQAAASSVSMTFGSVSTVITPPTTFGAGAGPIVYIN